VDTKLLIDANVHQTTVLIAQLSTAAGIRAPLAHIADQVFVELSREIEAQGVSRKVVADMFGLAIRSYQKKVQRLTESVSARDRTLWQAVIEALEHAGSLSRRELLARFQHDDPVIVGSVLNDLVSSGLVKRSGSGEGALFVIATERDFAPALREQRHDLLVPIVWVVVYRSKGATLAALREQLGIEEQALLGAIGLLEADGRVSRVGEGETATYSASTVLVPVDAEHGWEAAVFDHFQTVVRAIGTKVRRGLTRSARDDVNGGATLTFELYPDHPHTDEVLALLRRMRADVNELWSRVDQQNREHPEKARTTRVSFYFGQCVTSEDDA
jgi:hypothetical protein